MIRKSSVAHLSPTCRPLVTHDINLTSFISSYQNIHKTKKSPKHQCFGEIFYLLANTLSQHRICNLQEACDVSTCYIVTFHAVLLGCIIQIVEDINHDGLQLCINLFEGPGKSLTVLAHLQSGGSTRKQPKMRTNRLVRMKLK